MVGVLHHGRDALLVMELERARFLRSVSNSGTDTVLLRFCFRFTKNKDNVSFSKVSLKFLDEMMPVTKNVEFPYLLLWSILFLAQKSWLPLLQSRSRRRLHVPLSSSSQEQEQEHGRNHAGTMGK